MTDATSPDLVALVERLLKVESGNADFVTGLCTNWHRNPDGLEAADVIQAQAATIQRLDADCSGIADQAYALEADRDKLAARIAELEGEAYAAFLWGYAKGSGAGLSAGALEWQIYKREIDRVQARSILVT